MAVIGAVAAPSGAFAAPSAYDQYVPLTPSASGPTAPGGHGHRGGPGSVPLSSAAATRLQRLSGPDRSVLEAIATSRDLGAPTLGDTGSGRGAASNGSGPTGGSSGAAPGGGGADTRAAPTVPPTSSTLSAAVNAIGHSPALPLTVLAALAGALVAGTLRRRRA